MKRPSTLVLLLAAIGCAARGYTAPVLAPLPWPADTLRTSVIADGVSTRYLYIPRGPWAVQVLDVDLSRCTAAEALKGVSAAPAGAIGRVKTTDLLRDLSRRAQVLGGVNADFFSLAVPLGVPTGLLVANGTVLAGPGEQAVLAFDSAGAPSITTLHVSGTIVVGALTVPLANWNRASRTGVAYFDAHYASRSDTATGAIEVVLEGHDPARVAAVDTLPSGVSIPTGGGVIVVGAAAPVGTRARFAALRVGDTMRVRAALMPFHPRDAVGGRPWLARAGIVNPAVDSGGPTSFNVGRNPRTAAGITDHGRRLILAVVDGRQMPYSDGMSLREVSTLMLALGARDVINLDGGGSSTMVVSEPATGALRIANRPSDKEGERAVGDALAIVRRCH